MSPISKEGIIKGTGLTFQLGFSRKIANIMVKDDIQKVLKASGKPKNVVDESAKQCQTCPAVYYGQTRRSIEESFKEHMSMVRTRGQKKSQA
jgi:hypothetical protein